MGANSGVPSLLVPRALLLGTAFTAALAALAPATPAMAYVCSQALPSDDTSDDPPSLSWFSREIPYSLHPDGTARILDHDEDDVLRAAFAVWGELLPQDGGPCDVGPGASDLRMVEQPRASTDRNIGFNFLTGAHNENTLIFRDNDWDEIASHSRMVIALTTTTHNTVTGEIYDADIEFNSEDFTFTVGDDAVDTDLMNTAVHEIGHLLGLGHTLANTAQGLSFAASRETTMYAEAVAGETKKRTLHCDDARAIAFKYPAAQENGYCPASNAACGGCMPPLVLPQSATVTMTSRDDGLGGCAATGPRHDVSPLWMLLLCLGWDLRRRRPNAA